MKVKFTKTVTHATFNSYVIIVWSVESDLYFAQNHFNNINKYYTLMYLLYFNFSVTQKFCGIWCYVDWLVYGAMWTGI